MTNSNIWKKLSKKHHPFFVQAPMEDVTDTVFRQIIAHCSPPHLYFTEFTNVDSIASAGRSHAIHRLRFTETEKPIIAQIWGNTPKNYFSAAKMIQKMNFDGIDINMGCPQRKITKKGSCSALIKNHKLAQEIISATQEGSGSLPVSVKTRLGFSHLQTEEWIGFLLKQNLDAVIVHTRTVKEQSKTSPHWDEMSKVIDLRNKFSPSTIIVGNGDVKSQEQAVQLYKKHQVDGVMIGRGIFQNLWIFDQQGREKKSQAEKLELLKKHIALFEKTWGDKKNFAVLKRFFKIYINESRDASTYRQRLMETKTKEDALSEIKQIEKRYKQTTQNYEG